METAEKAPNLFSDEAKRVMDLSPRERAALIAGTANDCAINRARLDRVEDFLLALSKRGALGRLKWLLTGK